MPPVVRVSENIYQVHAPIPFPLTSVNCYLIRDSGGWAMIDTGLHHAPALKAWNAAFESLGLQARDIRRIYLTHAHPDHYGLAGYFQRLSSVTVYALDKEISLVLIVMLALLVYYLLEHLVRQAQPHLTGRTMLETFATYTVVLLQFADGSRLWTYPELTTAQAALLADLGFAQPQTTLMLV